MIDNLLFHELLLLGLLWLCVIWCWRWSKRQAVPGQAHGQPIKRSQRLSGNSSCQKSWFVR
jgi:hypothetical protein